MPKGDYLIRSMFAVSNGGKAVFSSQELFNPKKSTL